MDLFAKTKKKKRRRMSGRNNEVSAQILKERIRSKFSGKAPSKA